jgi:hypothetical protein
MRSAAYSRLTKVRESLHVTYKSAHDRVGVTDASSLRFVIARSASTLLTSWLVNAGKIRSHHGPQRRGGKIAISSSCWGRQFVLSGTMKRSLAFWTAFVSAFVASGLALRVALRLALAAQLGGEGFVSELAMQSRVAAVAGLAALVSAIAQIIEKASK